MTKEFILHINGEGFYIYGKTEDEALTIFVNMCQKHKQTNNNNYMSYWSNLISHVKSRNFIITENLDFEGVRKIYG